MRALNSEGVLERGPIITTIRLYFYYFLTVRHMTILIGAICENKYVVLATDRMITVHQPNIEYQQAGITKALEITPSCFAATSGSALAFTNILSKVKSHLRDNPTTDVEKISEIIRNFYITCRREKVEELILSPIGLDIQTYWQTNQSLQPSLAGLILNQMMEYHHQLWVMIAGVDESGAHLWHVENPGTRECLDTIGFHAVGSGQDHARSSFIGNNFDPTLDLSHGLAVAFEAKRRSEWAPGVGDLTDILIIGKTGFKRLTNEEISRLNDIYEKKLAEEKSVISELDKLIEGLDISPSS